MQELANTPPSQLPHPATAVPPQLVATPPVMPPMTAAPADDGINVDDLYAFANASSSESSVATSLTPGSASVSTRNSMASLGDQSLVNDVLDALDAEDAELVDELFDVNELVNGLTNEVADEPAAGELAVGLACVKLADELADKLVDELADKLADGE